MADQFSSRRNFKYQRKLTKTSCHERERVFAEEPVQCYVAWHQTTTSHILPQTCFDFYSILPSLSILFRSTSILFVCVISLPWWSKFIISFATHCLQTCWLKGNQFSVLLHERVETTPPHLPYPTFHPMVGGPPLLRPQVAPTMEMLTHWIFMSPLAPCKSNTANKLTYPLFCSTGPLLLNCCHFKITFGESCAECRLQNYSAKFHNLIKTKQIEVEEWWKWCLILISESEAVVWHQVSSWWWSW